MNNSKHYSNEDFQMIIDDQYEGDRIVFETHLTNCDQCHKHYKAYLSLSQFLKYQVEVPDFKFDLAEEVLYKIDERKGTNLFFDKIFNGLLVVIGLFTVIMCLNYLIVSSMTIDTIFLSIFILGIYFAISVREFYILNHKFSKLINL